MTTVTKMLVAVAREEAMLAQDNREVSPRSINELDLDRRMVFGLFHFERDTG